MVSFIAIGIGEAIIGPTLPNLAAQTFSNIGSIGFLFTALGFGHMIGAFGGGRLYDRMQGHWLTAAMFLAASFVYFSIPNAPSLSVLALLIVILGIAQGAMDVGINTLLIWVHDAAAAPYLNALQFFFGIGAFICPLVIAQSRQITGGVKGAYIFAAITMLPVAIWLISLKPPQKPDHQISDNGNITHPLLIFGIALFLMLYIGVLTGFSGWLYTIITTEKILPIIQADYLVSAFWGSLTVGRLVMIPISRQVNPLKLLFFDVLGCTLTMLLFITFREQAAIVWLTTILMGFFIASVFPSAIALANKYMHMSGTVTGLTFLGGNTGTLFIPWIFGQIFQASGGKAVLIAILVDLLLVMGVLLFLTFYTRKLPIRRNSPI
ncbi:MAG: MFS transporter [Anaerolineaceae bacterium]|nr:MFS transporter [Anaerolineaceae bacterium]